MTACDCVEFDCVLRRCLVWARAESLMKLSYNASGWRRVSFVAERRRGMFGAATCILDVVVYGSDDHEEVDDKASRHRAVR
jgi:hypothetical protein